MKAINVSEKAFVITVTVAVIFFALISYYIYRRDLIQSKTEPAPVSKIYKKGMQYVLISFDGSRSVGMWKDTINFADEMRASGKPISFTYFVNGIYFLTAENAHNYTPPRAPIGTSKIGYGYSLSDIEERTKQVNIALSKGHEIGSHTVGHFEGHDWGYEDWKQEFSEQVKMLSNITKNNPGIAESKINMDMSKMHGFRAPALVTTPSMYIALKDAGFRYDSSGVGKVGEMPKKDQYGIWHIPLVSIMYSEIGMSTLSMDYNIWAVQTGNQEVAVRGTEFWKKLYDQTLDGYINYFNTQYNSNRAPVVIGHHFSLWNDGVYFEALKEFAREVCGKPEVYCTTMDEYVDYLEHTQN